MNDQDCHVVAREIVQIGDTEMTVEYSDVVWDDFELPPRLGTVGCRLLRST